MMDAIDDVADYEQLVELWADRHSSTSSGNRWARVWWDGDAKDEETLQEATGATLRCLPLAEDACGVPPAERCVEFIQFAIVLCLPRFASPTNATMWARVDDRGVCVVTGRPTTRRAIFAKAY